MADPPADAVREHLERTLASRAFLRAESLSRLLRFIVERELAGDRGQLREQIIAEEVFGRRDFDPQTDTIVRTQARRLRERLAEYDRTEGREQAVRIVLEKGSYVPVFRSRSPAPLRAPIPESSIVVLPFLNLTGNPDEEHFSDGLTEEVINVLTRVRGLRVVARTSAFAFKTRDVDVREIGERLGVASVLEGSVRRSGDELRVTAQLISCRTGFHFWSEKYDRRMSEIFQVQDEIAGSIVATLLRARPPVVPRAAPASMEAYGVYLKGLQEFFSVSTEGIQRAIELFGRAMEIDPSFAPAPAYLGMTLATIGWWGFSPAPDVMPRARELALRALALDPGSAEARLALATVRFAFDHDVDGALGDLDDLLDLAPGFAFAKLVKAYVLLAHSRHDEAADAVRQANELDPLSVMYVYNQSLVAYFARRWDLLETFGRAAAELAPSFAESHLSLGVACMQTGRLKEAVPHMEKAISLSSPIAREYLVICYCRSRQWNEAETELDRLAELARQTYVAPHRFAIATSAFPDTDLTFAHLERAFEARDPRLIWLRAWPVFDHLHGDPRFERLCQRLGLI